MSTRTRLNRCCIVGVLSLIGMIFRVCVLSIFHLIPCHTSAPLGEALYSRQAIACTAPDVPGTVLLLGPFSSLGFMSPLFLEQSAIRTNPVTVRHSTNPFSGSVSTGFQPAPYNSPVSSAVSALIKNILFSYVSFICNRFRSLCNIRGYYCSQ